MKANALIFVAKCHTPYLKSARRAATMARASPRLQKKPAPPPVEPTKRLQIFRPALAQYLKDAAAAIEDVNVFTLRGNHKWSLNYELLMNKREYSALLLGSELVKVKADGSVDVMRDVWDSFLHVYHLRDMVTKEGVCEFTKGQINYAAMMKDPIPGNDKFHILRIGEGDPVVGTDRINNGDNPPRFGRTIRSAHRRLFCAVSDELTKVLRDDSDDVASVMKWVELENILHKESQEEVEATKRHRSSSPSKSKSPPKSPTKSLPSSSSNTPPRPAQKSPPRKKMFRIRKSPKKQKPPTMDTTKTFIPVPKQPQKASTSLDFPFNSSGPKSQPTAITMSTVLNKLPPSVQEKLSEMAALQARMDELKLEIIDEIEGIGSFEVEEETAAEVPAANIYTKPVPTSLLSHIEELTGIPLTTAKPDDSAAFVNTFDRTEMNLGNLLRSVLEQMDQRGMSSYESINSTYDYHVARFRSPKNNKAEMVVDVGLGGLLGDLHGDEKRQVVRSIIDYLVKNETEATTEALREAKMIPKEMNEYEIYATMEHSGILPYNWKLIVQCLKCFHDIDGLWASEAKVHALGNDHNKVHVDVYDYNEGGTGKVKERIRYWWKDPVDEFLSIVKYLMKSNNINPANIARVKCVHGGDHASSGAKPKHRFLAKCIIEMKKEEGKDKAVTYSQIYVLADVQCKKDTDVVLENTILKPMCKGMDKIAEGKLLFFNEGSGDKPKYEVKLCDDDDPIDHKSAIAIKDPICFLTGDLKFLAVVLGKADFDTWWCCYCNIFKDDWQTKPDITAGQLWTVASLTERAQSNTTAELEGRARGGVKRKPFVEKQVHVVFPALHAMIGLGNDLLKYFFDTIDADIEPISREELELRESVAKNKTLLQTAIQDYEVWKSSEDGGAEVITLKTCQKDLKRIMKQMDQGTDEYKEMETAKKDVDDRLKALNMVCSKYENEVKRLKKELAEAPAKLTAYRKGRKLAESSLYNRCEDVLKEHGIDRSRYHGGSFNGVNIIKIMQKHTLVDELETILLESGRETEQKVKKLCADVKTSLRAWDSIFSDIHRSNPSEDFCDKLQSDIDAAMAQWRVMGLSVTPKLHGLECHVVQQMRSFGGIVELLEYWVEQEHQIGNRKDINWRNRTFESQGKLRARHEVAKRATQTIDAVKAVTKKFTNIRKRRQKETTTEKIAIKEEGRKVAIDLLRERMLSGSSMADYSAIINDSN